jgi:phosphopantothenoylcysteine decarboxylase
MARILLGVTGSVAAIRTPILFDLLKTGGHEVRIVATKASLYFFDAAHFSPLIGPDGSPKRNRNLVTLDEDEWPGLDHGKKWQRNEPVLHIELRRWADLLLIAPLDANTLAKMALGLTDNCLTCVARAWDPHRPIVLAPAMNTFMWQHPGTARHLRQLAQDAGSPNPPPNGSQSELIEHINQRCPRLRIAPTVVKELACQDTGDGAMATPEDIVAIVQALLAT